MIIKANNINFFIDPINQIIKRSKFDHGAMLFSDVDDGNIPASEGSAVFFENSDQLIIFRNELKSYLAEYKLALLKFRKLRAFI